MEVEACTPHQDRTCECAAGFGSLDVSSSPNTCAECEAGSGFAEAAGEDCVDCMLCGEGAQTKDECTPTSDRTCECQDGYEKLDAATQVCTACAAEHFADAGTRAEHGNACQPWRNCPAEFRPPSKPGGR